MRLFLVTYGGEHPGAIAAVLDSAGVSGYTRMSGAHGHGKSGAREGTRAWPGDVTVFYVLADEAVAARLTPRLRRQTEQLATGERLHVAVLPVEDYF